MKLFKLTASICNVFSVAASAEFRTIQKVKDDEVRDVVTSLDLVLHESTFEFVHENMPECRILSEEDNLHHDDISSLGYGEWLIVDPLDGSNNYALSLPGYGYMAAHMIDGIIDGSAIVLPEHDLYFVFDSGEMIISQPFESYQSSKSGSVYYAYPPKLFGTTLHSRMQLIELIDEYSSGLYRYGSACVGLYNMIRGRHKSFIAHRVRIWDVIAYFPILKHFNISFKYHINSSGVILIASNDNEFLFEACSIISYNEGVIFNSFLPNQGLVFT